MDSGKDIKMFGVLMLGLFAIAVIAGLTYIGADYLKDASCTAIDSTYDFDGSTCVNSTGSSVTVTAITKINVVMAVIDIALGLLALVVLMAIFKLVIKQAKSFGGGY